MGDLHQFIGHCLIPLDPWVYTYTIILPDITFSLVRYYKASMKDSQNIAVGFFKLGKLLSLKKSNRMYSLCMFVVKDLAYY